MKFELNEYHRNISDEELLQDVKNVALKLNKQSITTAEYDEVGTFNHTTIARRFGSWKETLSKAGLETEGHNFYISDQEYIKDLQRVASEIGNTTITCGQYEELGKYDRGKLSKRFGSWDKALIAAGLENTGFHRNISYVDLFHEIENMWIRKGSQPTTTDVKNGYSKYSLHAYTEHFGSWRGALQAFVQYIEEANDDEPIDEESSSDVKDIKGEPVACKEIERPRHKTSRDVNYRLRFKVMHRDNFKCCICGNSPAKDSAIELHIDHIIPWSKGGETIMENLQTLCSKCNLGKSDLDM